MLNQKERDSLACIIAECAFFYGKHDLDREKIIIFINTLNKFYSEYSFKSLENAFNNYIHDTKNKFFPNPSQLREYLEKKIDSKLSATELARKLDKLILDYGLTWNDGYFHNKETKKFRGADRVFYWTFEEAVISEVGELGLEIINSRGGWKIFCRSGQETSNETSFQAQLRDTCEFYQKNKLYEKQENELLESKANINLLG